MRRCSGKNLNGNRCRKKALTQSRYCQLHREQAKKIEYFFPGALGGAATGAVLGGMPGAVVGFAVGAIFGKSMEREVMAASKVFISFDYDNDSDLKTLLVGQSKHDDTPFDISDWSVKEHIDGDWKERVRSKLRRVDQVAIICGEKTHTAVGVSAEIKLAQEESIPYFLLYGRSSKTCTKPTAAKSTDKMYKWTWDNLKTLVGGGR
tara:strand:+ start:787 stop:1404 length:618 start_codon:yes stop_codon:yes gene_type:complete